MKYFHLHCLWRRPGSVHLPGSHPDAGKRPRLRLRRGRPFPPPGTLADHYCFGIAREKSRGSVVGWQDPDHDGLKAQLLAQLLPMEIQASPAPCPTTILADARNIPMRERPRSALDHWASVCTGSLLAEPAAGITDTSGAMVRIRVGRSNPCPPDAAGRFCPERAAGGCGGLAPN